MSTTTIAKTVYLVLGARFTSSGWQQGVTTAHLFTKKPNTKAGEVALKLTLELPAALFQRPQIEATINVPDTIKPLEITPAMKDNIAAAIQDATQGFDVSINVEPYSEVQA